MLLNNREFAQIQMLLVKTITFTHIHWKADFKKVIFTSGILYFWHVFTSPSNMFLPLICSSRYFISVCRIKLLCANTIFQNGGLIEEERKRWRQIIIDENTAKAPAFMSYIPDCSVSLVSLSQLLLSDCCVLCG